MISYISLTPSLAATITVPILVLCMIGSLVVGLVLAGLALKAMGGKTIAQAKTEASRILEDAKNEAQINRKQIELEAKNELIARRETAEKEAAKTRSELKESERRLTKREDNLDRKLDVLTTKEKHLDTLQDKVQQREDALKGKEKQVDEILQRQEDQLLKIADLSKEDAKQILLSKIELEVRHDAGLLIQREMAKAEEDARDNSRKITIQAIQRYAAEHTTAATVTTVAIPSDDMKGRVIGREGRNIRAFEQATGVDVIVDDTPGVVVVSCFDPIRRAVASESLQKLIDDGRIHPSRIEEVVEQTQEEIREKIIRYGKDACIEANVQGLHPKVSEMIGRLHYRTSYGQNILRHSMEVAYLCQVIADELGMDGAMARRCGFLHDIGKAMDHEMEGGHPAIGMEFAKKFGEKEAVLNAIGGHHGDIESTTPFTPIVMAADAISGARPGARRETLDRYVKRLEQLEAIAKAFDGVQQAYAIQAGREVRVIADARKLDDASSAKVARDIAKRVEEEMTYPGEVRVTVLREVRNVEYAR